MGRIFCIIGKSSSGKDTIYKKLLKCPELGLKEIVPYTTRPIRAGEQEGVEYHFVTVEVMEQMRAENRIIESRFYDTVYGRWYYFTAKDSQLTLEKQDYLVIGTLASYIKTRDYFGTDKVVAIYIDLEDGERLSRALRREKKQSQPRYEEMCRRFIADTKDFSEENLTKAGVVKCFDNHCLKQCLEEITDYIISYKESTF
ncbi:MAG: guanylate kinase [Lachnospiraceae bacterium]|nr:guanylate kinase [Lachnospiraceae bacterium]